MTFLRCRGAVPLILLGATALALTWLGVSARDTDAEIIQEQPSQSQEADPDLEQAPEPEPPQEHTPEITPDFTEQEPPVVTPEPEPEPEGEEKPEVLPVPESLGFFSDMMLIDKTLLDVAGFEAHPLSQELMLGFYETAQVLFQEMALNSEEYTPSDMVLSLILKNPEKPIHWEGYTKEMKDKVLGLTTTGMNLMAWKPLWQDLIELSQMGDSELVNENIVQEFQENTQYQPLILG